ncbi:phosphodiesterase [Acidisoma cellulosilytica]|uniref:Phosphodiesterase n=1 Tax=Acidisoma cellulosilyticum TaxID=2802395 RepID=A0A963Z0Y2_9PROT|nr:phosphodiesterase [Acidisoma cellulosilyticum]MCB8880626.1 phosphodiesterase [Acidisoma cellulosilyticum]
MLIAQLSDLHVRPRGVPAARVVETNMLVERALAAVAALNPRPDAVVISGDVTECGRPEEYAMAAQFFRRHLAMPVFVVPGNHDRRDNFRAGLAHMHGVTQDPDFVQYVVDDYPVRLVMLDTLVPEAGYGLLCPKRMAFLERALSDAPTKPTMLVFHHPPMLTGSAGMDSIWLRNTAELGALLQKHPQVERILTGHHHRNIVGRLGHAIVIVAPSVVHQTELCLLPGIEDQLVLEPPAFNLHLQLADCGIATHTVYVERFPGPYPFVVDDDYPGYPEKAARA